MAIDPITVNTVAGFRMRRAAVGEDTTGNNVGICQHFCQLRWRQHAPNKYCEVAPIKTHHAVEPLAMARVSQILQNTSGEVPSPPKRSGTTKR